jgi:hypothetical protein
MYIYKSNYIITCTCTCTHTIYIYTKWILFRNTSNIYIYICICIFNYIQYIYIQKRSWTMSSDLPNHLIPFSWPRINFPSKGNYLLGAENFSGLFHPSYSWTLPLLTLPINGVNSPTWCLFHSSSSIPEFRDDFLTDVADTISQNLPRTGWLQLSIGVCGKCKFFGGEHPKSKPWGCFNNLDSFSYL